MLLLYMCIYIIHKLLIYLQFMTLYMRVPNYKKEFIINKELEQFTIKNTYFYTYSYIRINLILVTIMAAILNFLNLSMMPNTVSFRIFYFSKRFIQKNYIQNITSYI